jgi:heme/copper-type cytochrome/quinol oxidase subunit 2
MRCVFRSENENYELCLGTLMPPLNDQSSGMRSLIPWVPHWLDLNVMVPLIATVIVVAVGILVICVALTRRRDDDRGGPKDVYCRFTFA